MPGTVTLMLIYEPASGAASIPLAKISDALLAKAVGRKAVQIAMKRARRASAIDPAIGREEYIEANRLNEIFSVLMPSA